MTIKTIFLCLSIAFVCGREFPRRSSNNSKGSHHYIFGGEVARTDEAQFMVAVLCVKSFIIHRAHCGGVLIDSTTILTAAHCVAEKCDKFLVRYGTHKVDKKKFPDIEVDLKKNIIIHKNYDLKSFDKDIRGALKDDDKGVLLEWDIAIVKLPYPPNGNANIRFVELPITGPYDFDYDWGTEVTTYGWGYTNEVTKENPIDLMKTTLKIVNHLNGRIRPETGKFEDYSQIYCETASKISHICLGDSGGPLILNNVLIGITSGVLGECGEPDRVSIFTKVAYFRKWIEENRKKKKQ